MKKSKDDNVRHAKDLLCIKKCGRQAEVFYPIVDPDIPSYPYCRPCVTKAQTELLIAIGKLDLK